jgi:hypothetical protein
MREPHDFVRVRTKNRGISKEMRDYAIPLFSRFILELNRTAFPIRPYISYIIETNCDRTDEEWKNWEDKYSVLKHYTTQQFEDCYNRINDHI